MLNGQVQGIPYGTALLFDTDSVVTPEAARAFKADGYAGCLRYLSLGVGQNPGDLTANEAAGILEAGLALMPVQHVQGGMWRPSQNVGEMHGRNAADNARAIGFPAGVCVWLDLESENSQAFRLEIVDYCEAWYDAVLQGEFTPGIYVGPACGLSGDDLYSLPFNHYWRSAANVPDVPKRGYQMVQKMVTGLVNGIAIDDGLANPDQLGGRPIWLAPIEPNLFN